MPAAPSPAPGLRERKKRMTRQAILDAAEALFARDGYEGVTVAQIADRANISVKTLFTYFSSKEDLAFAGEDEMRGALVRAVTERPAGSTPLDAVRDFLKDLARQGEGARGVEEFHLAFGSDPHLRPRLLVMYERFEDALTAALAAETGTAGSGQAARLAAVQLVALLRLLTGPETRAALDLAPSTDPGSGPGPEEARERALLSWIDEAAAFLAAGIGGYGARATDD
ncbi:TetR/AcrR family transcriptional regulator [Streptomyces sp. SID11385]|uniref:TetR/AcrR family transcriptional regulator n=1 Tax=Streptomyces sp. SID11385 TaxID=2706031 RepID=UPI0013CB7898|nr:TetR/AcrR family transcriptional regulator [Streptomyces sp. SID11385]NEA41531.1 TetR/AcrR family transcriptional regulator [Streptomyces sp. SID11385]